MIHHQMSSDESENMQIRKCHAFQRAMVGNLGNDEKITPKVSFSMTWYVNPLPNMTSNVSRKGMMIYVCKVNSTHQNNLCINKLWIIHKVIPDRCFDHCCYFSIRNFYSFSYRHLALFSNMFAKIYIKTKSLNSMGYRIPKALSFNGIGRTHTHTEKPPFYRRHFRVHFRDRKCSIGWSKVNCDDVICASGGLKSPAICLFIQRFA